MPLRLIALAIVASFTQVSHSVSLTPRSLFAASLPSQYSNVNAVLVENNLAVIPGDWESGAITNVFYDVKTDDQSAASELARARNADFIIWDESFLKVIGPNAKVVKLQSFPPEEHRVHEAPVFLPETNEVLFSDTDIVGWLWIVNVETGETRKLHTDPPLHNVNGGTYHDGHAWLVTNGGKVRGMYKVDVTTGKAEVVLNNYRGRRLNSPNDLIFDSQGNVLFTDPIYGAVKWPGVQPPELPLAIYHFNPRTGAVTTLSNSIVEMPNGLALSRDEQTLYVADSASTPPSGGNLSSPRNVWAFDYHGTVINNPRLIYQADAGWPDGVRITMNGYLFIAMAGGVDVIDPTTGRFLGKISTPDDIIFNLQAAGGKGQGIWILTGMKHIYKVTIAETSADYSLLSELMGSAEKVAEKVKSYVAGSEKQEL